MTKQIKFILFFTAAYIFICCSSSINIKDYFDKTAPFNLTIKSTDTATGFTQSTQSNIAVNSEKYLTLVEWLNNNEQGWQRTPASYIADVAINQGSFSLLCIKREIVVIGFVDKENNPRQYTKSIKKGELDFLTTK